jgi:hypothetical protein
MLRAGKGITVKILSRPWWPNGAYRRVSLFWHLNDSVLYTFLSRNSGSQLYLPWWDRMSQCLVTAHPLSSWALCSLRSQRE